MGKVADPAKQPPGDTRGPARPARDLLCSISGEIDVEEPRCPANDLLQFFDRVEIEADRDSEAVAERGGEQPLAGRRADEGELREVDPHRARRWPLADHDVERAVLHRWIEHFLDR